MFEYFRLNTALVILEINTYFIKNTSTVHVYNICLPARSYRGELEWQISQKYRYQVL